MSKPILFPLLFLVIAAPFYFMNLHSIHELNDFLSHAVHENGSVLDRLSQSPHPQKRHPETTCYLLQVDNPSSLPARVWATGENLRLAIGDKVTFYYLPDDLEDARVLDGKEISRYKMKFFIPSLLLTIMFFSVWLAIEKEIVERDGIYTES